MKSRSEKDLNVCITEREMSKSVGQEKIEFEISSNKENNFDEKKSSVLNRYDEARAMSPDSRAARKLENWENIEKEKGGRNLNRNNSVSNPGCEFNSAGNNFC